MSAALETMPWLKATCQGCGCLIRPSRTNRRRSCQILAINSSAASAVSTAAAESVISQHSNIRCSREFASVEVPEKPVVLKFFAEGQVRNLARLHLFRFGVKSVLGHQLDHGGHSFHRRARFFWQLRNHILVCLFHLFLFAQA